MKKLMWPVMALLAFTACNNKVKETKLPIYGTREPITKMVGGKQVTDTVYATIPPFSFVDQERQTITENDLHGKIYVADFFFTSCPSICPVMQRNMVSVAKAYQGKPDFKLVSFTIDPRHDTIPVLKEYAEKLGAKADQWYFLLGKKEDVYQLAEKNYLVSVSESNTAPGGYVHQGWLVLVDKKGRVRGAYDGTDKKQVDQLIVDVKVLMDEEENPKT
ncbi:SCO family protein [Mucilaginibacter arboris]|uniref:SCO family protein n=1 Tax=Mucilaginibacter arboris TaxID=2682090 RepID=A0A7K1SU60_9SPHI|nr:SCO family protein [Mucilaginibacter arboris]MVN20797.1 SCO family protein [Mucilaginibacter arboris]